MNRLLLPLFIAVLSLYVVACNDDNDQKPEPPKPSQETEDTEESTEWKIVETSNIDWDGVKMGNITYQTLVYSFSETGDFNGISEKLDYIDKLGASAIWLSPIHPAGSYHGYDVMDYDAVNPQYGTDSDFDKLIATAHSKGIKVYLDYVLNHTSSKHPWFLDAKHDINSKYRNFYIFSSDPGNDIKNQNIPMFEKDGYNSGEWFTLDESEARSDIYKFTLNWNDKTITVSKADTPDKYDGKGDKYLWYGDISEAVPMNDMGDGIYERTIDYSSTWGFLIRTSTTTWNGGTKYGAPTSTSRITLDKPFKLDNTTANDIQFDDVQTWLYHSMFYTDAFADLNYGNITEIEENETFKAMVKSAQGWIDRGVDGFRLDAVKHIYHSATSNENPEFLKKFYDHVNEYFHKSHNDDIYMVGEVLDGANTVAPYYKGLPALFEFDFWYRLEWAINNSTGCYFPSDIMGYQELYANSRTDFIEATKLSNHDEDRTAYKLGNNENKMRLAAAVLLTSAGEPYIYYGEEIGMTGNKLNGDENVRKAFLWDEANKQGDSETSLLSSYRKLCRLRNSTPALSKGKISGHETYNSKNTEYKNIAAWYMTCKDPDQKLLVIHNFSANNANIKLEDPTDNCLLTLGSVESCTENGAKYIRLGAYASAVFNIDK